ncbi:hypothetical protein [Aureivirga sp. CE67]|uniref:hypothetical protein n=1 Tax=Aureivirga sp. CE67 TaxID=1788983 RepID=UPI0018CB2632|nr:hypothetical protein [Aureivirga sp. CE67]
MTKQITEFLKFKDTEYFLDHFLLEFYFQEFPERKPEGEIETCMWRGYFSDYEIVNEELFVAKLHVSRKGKYKSVLNEVFPKSKKMIWFSGLILIDQHKTMKPNTNNNFEENYLIIEIKNGNVSEIRKYNRERLIQFKSEQSEYFKLTEEYEILKEKYKIKLKQNYEYNKDKVPKKELKRYKFEQTKFDEYIDMFILNHSKEFLAD